MKLKLILMLASLLLASAGLAHTGLAHSTPENGAQLQQSPASIELEFTAAVMLASLQLEDADGNHLELQFKPRPAANEMHRVDLPPLADGSYQVIWKALGADGHAVEGTIGFSLAATGS